MGKSRAGNLQEEYFEYELKNTAENRDKELISGGDNFVVHYTDSNRYYEIDRDGNVSDPKYMINDEFAGDVTKGNTCDGSENNPYQINCIEDLVEFSIMTNRGNSDLKISANNFNNKYIVLTRDLDFNSIFSYSDYTTNKYGDLNTDGVVEDIRTELTKKDEGCTGFQAIGKWQFLGYFDGKEHEIRNVYQHVNSGSTALFKTASKEIKNVIVTGTIINSGGSAGGICAAGNKVNINNCKNYANITGCNMVGGIVSSGNPDVENCENFGSITMISGRGYFSDGAGGICGSCTGNIYNCINYGKINSNIKTSNIDFYVGGIAGFISGSTIDRCINKGESSSGGIVGWATGDPECTINNCYNIGKCKSAFVMAYGSTNWNSNSLLNIKNSYNLGECSYSEMLGNFASYANKTITLNIDNCYNAGKSNVPLIKKQGNLKETEKITNIKNTYYNISRTTDIGVIKDGITGLTEQEIKSQDFVDTLNANIGENSDWSKWKLGEDGYPTFE